MANLFATLANAFAIRQTTCLRNQPSTANVACTERDPTKDDQGQRAVQSVEVGGRLLLALADQPGADDAEGPGARRPACRRRAPTPTW